TSVTSRQMALATWQRRHSLPPKHLYSFRKQKLHFGKEDASVISTSAFSFFTFLLLKCTVRISGDSFKATPHSEPCDSSKSSEACSHHTCPGFESNRCI